MQQVRWGQFEYANLRYENITLWKWGLWTGDYLHPTAPEVQSLSLRTGLLSVQPLCVTIVASCAPAAGLLHSLLALLPLQADESRACWNGSALGSSAPCLSPCTHSLNMYAWTIISCSEAGPATSALSTEWGKQTPLL